MRTLVLCAVFVTACGGSSSSIFSGGVLSLSAVGTITTPEGTVNATGEAHQPLADHRAPTSFGFTFDGGGRTVSADASSLVAALGGKSLLELDGTELHANEVFNGQGVVSGSVSPQNLAFAYVVQTYAPSSAPFLVVAASASNSGDSVYATLTFSSQ